MPWTPNDRFPFPAWMFSQPYLDRLAALYRKQMEPVDKLRRQVKNHHHDRVIGTDQKPTVEGMLLALRPRWLHDRHPPKGPHHLSDDDDAARFGVASVEWRWRISIAHRIRLVEVFAGLNNVAFSKLVGWPVTQNRAQFMSRLITGDTTVSMSQCRVIAEIYSFAPSWFLAENFWDADLPDPSRPAIETWGAKVTPDNMVRVVRAEITLSELGISTSVPHWAQPYFLIEDCRVRDRMSDKPNKLKLLLPQLADPPPGIPECSWADLLASVGGDERTGPSRSK
jgi:hypothetical protein